MNTKLSEEAIKNVQDGPKKLNGKTFYATLNTVVSRRSRRNCGYPFDGYIMIDVVINRGMTDEYIMPGMAEAHSEDDIPNARRRALYCFKRIFDLLY